MNRTSLRRIGCPQRRGARPRHRPHRLRRRQRVVLVLEQQPTATPLRQARRRRLQRPGVRAWTPGAPASRRPTAASPSTTTRPAPARASRSSTPVASTSPAPTPPSTPRRARSPPPRSAAAPDAIEVPDYVSPIAVVFNLEGVDKLQLSADDHRRHLRRQDQAVERPGHQGREPRRQAARASGSPRCTAPTSPAPPRTSPTTSRRPATAPGSTPPTRCGRSSPARPPTAPPA